MMSCAEFEVLLSDYIDGTLDQATREDLDRHVASCAACAEMFADANAAVAFIGRVSAVTLPPDLVTRIAYQAPTGPIFNPLQRRGFWGLLFGRWLQPLLQPRFAMGMAMTILSFAMLERCTGIQVQHIRPGDLNPVRVWDGFEDRAMRTRDRAVKYYENLRVVYDIESRLRDLREEEPAASPAQPSSKPEGKQSKAQPTPQTNLKKGDQSK
jgi:hypothetical protein